MFLPVALFPLQSIVEIKKCNEYTSNFALQLSEEEIKQLVENRKEVLERCGRIEFGGGVLQKMIMEFADSPFIYQDNYTSTIMELQECFYYLKNETLEEVTDDELLHMMKRYFDDVCQGSIDYLKSTIIENYSRDVRYGTHEYIASNGYEDNYIEFFDGDKEGN